MATSGDSDSSHGWEGVAGHFLAYAPHSTIGVATVRQWAAGLPSAAAVLDLGCGPGGPRSAALQAAGLTLFGVDAAPTLAAAYATRFPTAHVACEAVEHSTFFQRQFEAALAWGLLFLLPPDTQLEVIHRVSSALRPGGRFLFTAPALACEWKDTSTGRPSLSLGRSVYEMALRQDGLQLRSTTLDEGENHYYDAIKADGPVQGQPRCRRGLTNA
jgi:SAM-dependent methyltransferase